MFGFKKRAEERKKQEDLYLHRRGFDYAAGKLLRGENTRNLFEEVEREDLWRGPFEAGVCEAVHIWIRMKGKQ